MTGEGDRLRSIAIGNLTALGLSEYAARTLVALTRIDGGSAREVSDTSSVPRTRVYDAVDELADRGFVRVQESQPKAFSPVSPTRIRRAFYREYVYKQVLAEWGLRALGATDDTSELSDIDVAIGTDAVHRHFLAAITDAQDRVTYVSVGGSPSDDIVTALDDATTRGVAVEVVCVGDADSDQVSEAVPTATVLPVPNTATPPSGGNRFLVVDETLALLGTRDVGTAEPMEIGLFSEHSDADVTVLLQQVADTWLADGR